MQRRLYWDFSLLQHKGANTSNMCPCSSHRRVGWFLKWDKDGGGLLTQATGLAQGVCPPPWWCCVQFPASAPDISEVAVGLGPFVSCS